MNYRQFSTKFWRDGYISKLTNLEKLFFIYLFTNDKVNKVGIYELPEKFILVDMDISKSQLKTMKTKFENDARYMFHNDWVYILNFADHNKYSTADNVINSYELEYNSIPLNIRKYFFDKVAYVCPIKSTDRVMVSVNGYMLLLNRVGGRVGPRVQSNHIGTNEDINPDEIPI